MNINLIQIPPLLNQNGPVNYRITVRDFVLETVLTTHLGFINSIFNNKIFTSTKCTNRKLRKTNKFQTQLFNSICDLHY